MHGAPPRGVVMADVVGYSRLMEADEAGIAAASGALAGKMPEAEKTMALVRQLNPTLRLPNLKKLIPIRRPEDFQGPKPRCSSATFKEFVPVRPKPRPIISKAMLLSRRVFERAQL